MQKALDEGNLRYILDEGLIHLYSSSSNRKYEVEVVEAVKDYLYRILEPIAKSNNIQVEEPTKLIDAKKELKKVKTSLAKPESDNEDFLSDMERKLTRVYNSLGRDWISEFIEGENELLSILNNPQLRSETTIMLEKWEELDKQMPLEKPLKIFVGDANDWGQLFDDNMYRLETPDEVQARIAKIKNERREELKSAAGIDNVAIFRKWWSFVNYLPKTKEIITEITDELNSIAERKHNLKFNSFKKDEQFYNELLKIMEHDKSKYKYWYHGTSDSETGYKIMQEGLVMASNDLSRTAYPEFTPEQLVTYSRGLMGEIGADGVVIIRQPLTENRRPVNIVENNTSQIAVTQSGLGGFSLDPLKYLVPPQYIVGYIDKYNHKVITNPECPPVYTGSKEDKTDNQKQY